MLAELCACFPLFLLFQAYNKWNRLSLVILVWQIQEIPFHHINSVQPRIQIWHKIILLWYLTIVLLFIWTIDFYHHSMQILKQDVMQYVYIWILKNIIVFSLFEFGIWKILIAFYSWEVTKFIAKLRLFFFLNKLTHQ